jgi:hypothetical protein
MNSRIKNAAIKILIKELGFKRLMQIAPKLSARKKRGEPWQGLPLPQDSKDKASRALIEDAILLYRELLLIISQSEAERIIRNVIIESAIMQLYSLIPTLTKEAIAKLTPDQRKEQFCQIINQFPNADWTIQKVEPWKYQYYITRCRLVELIQATGHPELKNAFCAGDGIYFERYQKEVAFNRSQKIGDGASYCDFIFEVAPESSSNSKK